MHNGSGNGKRERFSHVHMTGLVTNYMWRHRERETNLRALEREQYGECSGSRVQEVIGNLPGV